MARWSGGSDNAVRFGKQAAPQISLRLGLTGNTRPGNPNRRRLSQTRSDQWPGRSEAPTSTTFFGWNRRSIALFLPADVIRTCPEYQRNRSRSDVLHFAKWAKSWTVRFLVEKLLHAVLLADLLVVLRQRVLLRLEIIARLLVVHLAHGADGFLGVAHHVVIKFHQLFGELDGLF